MLLLAAIHQNALEFEIRAQAWPQPNSILTYRFGSAML
jgi:hypothetical protein